MKEYKSTHYKIVGLGPKDISGSCGPEDMLRLLEEYHTLGLRLCGVFPSDGGHPYLIYEWER